MTGNGKTWNGSHKELLLEARFLHERTAIFQERVKYVCSERCSGRRDEKIWA